SACGHLAIMVRRTSRRPQVHGQQTTKPPAAVWRWFNSRYETIQKYFQSLDRLTILVYLPLWGSVPKISYMPLWTSRPPEATPLVAASPKLPYGFMTGKM